MIDSRFRQMTSLLQGGEPVLDPLDLLKPSHSTAHEYTDNLTQERVLRDEDDDSLCRSMRRWPGVGLT